MTAARPDHAREVRNALHDPRKLCHGLGLLKGAEEQAGGALTILCPHHQERTPSCSVSKGDDGTIRVRCFGCDWSGDALTLIAEVRGWSLQTQFRDILAEGAHLAGELQLEVEIRGDSERPAEQRKPVAPPPPATPKEYPPIAEAQGLWDASLPVVADAEAAAMLQSRAIDPAVAGERRLARVLAAGSTLPRWARYRGKADHARTWIETGHRILIRMWDSGGHLRSVRAWRVGDDESPKRLPPSGHRATEIVMANAEAVEILSGRCDAPARVVIVEGEPDWMTHAVRTTYAVIGLVSGAWTQGFADRIPIGSEVVIRTHHDQAGEKYAKQVFESLKDRVALSRSQSA